MSCLQPPLQRSCKLVLILMLPIRSSVADVGVPGFSAEAASRWCVLCDPRARACLVLRRCDALCTGLGPGLAYLSVEMLWCGPWETRQGQSVSSQGLSQFSSFHPRVHCFPVPVAWDSAGTASGSGPLRPSWVLERLQAGRLPLTASVPYYRVHSGTSPAFSRATEWRWDPGFLLPS